MVVLWLALRLALGRGSWPLLGVAAGIGLETKYTIAVVLVLLIATFLVWRRDVLRSWGFPLAVAIAAALLVPNLIWEAGHGWTSVHWFLNPPPSGSDETRPQFIVNVILLAAVAFPVAVAGVAVAHSRSRAAPVRLDGRRHGRRVPRARRQVVLRAPGAACSRSPPVRSRSIAGRRVAVCVVGRRRVRGGRRFSSCRSRCRCCRCTPPSGSESSRRAATTSRRSAGPRTCASSSGTRAGADVIVADNYGEAGALELFGRGLPPVASADVTMRFWRPQVAGRRALVVGYSATRGRLLQRLSRRRAHLGGERQRRGRRADRRVHAARHPRRGLAEHRRDARLLSRGRARAG